MDFDDNAVCEKIISEINAVFNKDRDLSGFEIIPMPSNQNKSPVNHVENIFGLESWCVKHVYEFSHRTILQNKVRNPKYVYNESVLKYLNCAILINPDVSTFWNIRRQLLERNKLNITKEFQFTSIVLHRKPKSSEAFGYRRWLFLFQSEESIDWSFELRLCERCADKNSGNYHAWTHRQWTLQKAPHLLSYELYFTEKFIKKHVSDYSCYHHRQFVFQNILDVHYFEEDEIEYNNLKELLNTLMSVKIDNTDDIINILLPDVNVDKIHRIIIKSFLFCMNLAAHDLKLCDDLKRIFDNREAFQNHRRLILKFILDSCRKFNKSSIDESNRNHLQPLTKVLKYESKQSNFLLALKTYVEQFSGIDKKWCETFLEFPNQEEL